MEEKIHLCFFWLSIIRLTYLLTRPPSHDFIQTISFNFEFENRCCRPKDILDLSKNKPLLTFPQELGAFILSCHLFKNQKKRKSIFGPKKSFDDIFGC